MNVEVKLAGKRGKGVLALKNFKKDELIFWYKKGKIGTAKQISKLPPQRRWYVDELDGNKFELMQPPARYVNHSCNPNSIQKGRAYFALKNIRNGDEITVDYRMKGIFKNKWKCYCRSKNCKGFVISDFFTLSPMLQKKYLPYTIDKIRDEYRRRHSKS